MERAFLFGQDRDLVGIVNEPDGQACDKNMPIVILLNAGLVHHVGPFRMNVEFARSLSNQGVLSFRFDLSGIGDSNQHKDSRSNEEKILGDIKSAMDFLSSKYDVDRFILLGLCTGADNAHKAAVLDKRVVGAVFLDGYVYPTTGYYMRHYGPRFFSPKVWFNKLKALFSSNKEVLSVQDNDYFWVLPPKNKVETELKGLVERNVGLMYIFSGGYVEYNYLNQFNDMYSAVDFQDKLHIEYFPRADHTYILGDDRKKLIDCVCTWVDSRYSKGA